ncbi:MAG: histidine kinase dimerization/phosphoacceptor domain -containing protein [Caulobacterales bacterium]
MIANILAWLKKTWPATLSISSIRGRIALFLALALLPAGVIAIQTGVNIAESRSKAVSERIAAQAESAHARVADVFSEMTDVLRVMATAREIRTMSRANCTETLSQLWDTYRGLGAIAVIDPDGRVRCNVPTSSHTESVQGALVFSRAAQRREMAFGYQSQSVMIGVPVFGGVAPIRGANDAIVGYVALNSPLQRIRHAAQTENSQFNLVLIDGNGDALGPPLLTASEVFDRPTSREIRAAVNSGQPRFRFGGADGLVQPLFAPDIYLLATWKPPSATWQDRLAFAFAVGWPLLMWLIAIAVSWLAMEAFVSRPLSQVEQAARSYVRGAEIKQDESIVNAPEEIRSLSRTLAAMARTLRVREQRLAEALREERALLREVHHRVKNNLQVVASLLSIQARTAQDSSEAWGLARAHDRIQLLSIIHQRIYSSGEVREIRLDEITREIARYLTQSRKGAIADIDLELNLGEVRCDIDHAVPMGFLIGESLSSALDLAPPRGKEKLAIKMAQDEGGEIRFTINAPFDARISAHSNDRARLIDAFARQVGAQVAHNIDGRYRVWGSTPSLLAA